MFKHCRRSTLAAVIGSQAVWMKIASIFKFDIILVMIKSLRNDNFEKSALNSISFPHFFVLMFYIKNTTALPVTCNGFSNRVDVVSRPYYGHKLLAVDCFRMETSHKLHVQRIICDIINVLNKKHANKYKEEEEANIRNMQPQERSLCLNNKMTFGPQNNKSMN
uniref:Uncharacterized protein n=1 Tax=Glossina pallidipes TaxID=7398 RepID=A0A1A9Z6V4_GLOPL